MASETFHIFLEQLEMLPLQDESNGLVKVDQRSSVQHPKEFRALEEAEGLGASHVYFRRFPLETKRPPTPEIFIFDQTEQALNNDQIADKVRLLWNSGAAPLAYVFLPDRVEILSALSKPKLDPKHLTSKFDPIETLVFADKIARQINKEKLERFSARAFDNGSFWENPDNSPLIANSKTALQSMLTNLRELRKAAEKQSFNTEAVNRLLIICLMVKFLEDRGAVSPDFFNKFRPGATDFFQVLENPQAFLRCVDALAEQFNGDVFALQTTDRDLIEETDLSAFAAFIEGRTYKKQLHFWNLYSFAHLPVELISYLYEDFIEPVDTNGMSQKGSVYTPNHLVDLILDEAMPLEQLMEAKGKFKVIDPACGSGVFLVGAYRRLVDAWRAQNEWQQPNASVLRKLLKDNIHGIDINPHAVELTIFSLCLSICGQMEPDQIWNSLRFDKLRGVNVLESNFFKVIQDKSHEAKFDLVLGNPPFGSTAKDKLSRQIEAKNRGNYPELPDFQISYLFLREAPSLLKQNKKGYLIIKDGFIYNLGAQDFRTQFLKTWHVPHVLDFVSIRGMFTGQSRSKPADVKVVSVCFEKRPPDSGQNLLHVTFRRVAKVKSRKGFEIDSYDLHWMPRELACEDPLVWKANLLGGGRLLNVYRRFSDEETLGEFLQRMKEERNWVFGEGVIKAKGTQCSEHLVGKKYLPPEAIRPDGSVDETLLEEFKVTRLQRPRNPKLFDQPQLLIREHESVAFTYLYDPVVFSDVMFGIASEDPMLLQLYSYLREMHSRSRFFTRFGSRYLVAKQSALKPNEIAQIPIGKDLKPLKFSCSEAFLADELETYQIPFIKYGYDPEKSPAALMAHETNLQLFSETFIKELRPYYPYLHNLTPVEFSNAWCLPFCFEKHPNIEIPNRDNMEHSLDNLLIQEGRSPIRIQRVVRLFHGNMLYFVKPKTLRFWLKSIALRDADETFEAINYHQSDAACGDLAEAS